MIEVPQAHDPAYQAADVQTLALIINWMNANDKSQSWLVKLSGIKPGTLSSLLAGKYPSSPAEWLSQAQAAIANFETASSNTVTPFVETSVVRLATLICRDARRLKQFGVLAGYVGTGKTRSLKELASAQPFTVLIEADPKMTPKVMLGEILHGLGESHRSIEKLGENARYRRILDKVTGTTYLIILDEAETVRDDCLHYLRRIVDKAQIGVVLAGTEDLQAKIRPNHGRFQQIGSRVVFWPEIVQRIDRDDADRIIEAALKPHNVEITKAITDRIWAYTQGSMRTLAQSLLPSLRRYGLKRHDLSVDLVDEIAEKVMHLPRLK